MEVGFQVATLQWVQEAFYENASLLQRTAFRMMQALVSGVAVMTPDNPWLFIEECLKQLILQEDELDLEW